MGRTLQAKAAVQRGREDTAGVSPAEVETLHGAPGVELQLLLTDAEQQEGRAAWLQGPMGTEATVCLQKRRSHMPAHGCGAASFLCPFLWDHRPLSTAVQSRSHGRRLHEPCQLAWSLPGRPEFHISHCVKVSC